MHQGHIVGQQGRSIRSAHHWFIKVGITPINILVEDNYCELIGAKRAR